MALPDLGVVCTEIKIRQSDLCITFPGGAEVCAFSAEVPPSPAILARHLLGQANSSLAPLGPIFTIIETLFAVNEVFTAVKDALGPPPDPTKLAEAIPGLAQKIDELAALIPQLSVPIMIVQSIDAIITLLEGMVDELEGLKRLQERITAAELKAGDIPALNPVILCAQNTLVAQQTNLERASASANFLIGLLNSFGTPIGIPEVPTVAELGSTPSAGITVLNETVDVMKTTRDAVPLP